MGTVIGDLGVANMVSDLQSGQDAFNLDVAVSEAARTGVPYDIVRAGQRINQAPKLSVPGI